MVSTNRFLNVLVSICIALIFTFIWFFCIHKTEFPGLSDVIKSIISFSSLIIGFYTAMYGLMFNIMNNNTDSVPSKIKTLKLENKFRFQLYYSLSSSFTAFIISVILQTKLFNSELLFYFWIFIVSLFLVVSAMTVILLVRIIFPKQNDHASNREYRN